MRVDGHDAIAADASGMRIAVITSAFNATITDGLRAGALAFLEESGARDVLSVTAPGAFEIPLLARKAAMEGYDAVVCLGAVIKGDTDHYDHVAHRASEGLMRVQLDTGVPVAFGILTVTESAHAEARAAQGPANKGRESAAAAVLAVRALRAIT
jgi:6,7-dimethyl-8-ribityllumazine synthase